MPRADRGRRIGFGLSIESDRAVPGTLPGDEGAAPDLCITTLPPRPFDDPPPPVYRRKDGTLIFSAPRIACYTCRRGAILVTPVPDADAEDVTALLIATALPAVAWLRGDTMLHAASVVAPTRQGALIIAGPSGVGKSAVTAQLLDRGGVLLADDSVRLLRGQGSVEASGLPGGYHLAKAGSDQERAFHVVPADRSRRSAPIGAVAILSRSDGPAMVERLAPVDAVALLLANLHRPAIPALLGHRAQALAMVAALAETCAVYRWHRPAAALSDTERDLLAREGLW